MAARTYSVHQKTTEQSLQVYIFSFCIKLTGKYLSKFNYKIFIFEFYFF